MGRYSTRFQAGGSNAVGATYTAAAGGGNSKFAVAANGQTLSRTDYPALSAFYSGQSDLATFSLNNIANSPAAAAGMFGQSNYSTLYDPIYGGGERATTFSGFTIHIQTLQNRDNTSERNSCVWYTTNGDDWKVSDLLSPPVGDSASFITTSSAVYLCHQSGLLRTTDGLNFTGIYENGVYGLTELNGVVIFSTGGTGVLKTEDFNTFTGVDTPGFTVNAIVTHSGTLYAFDQATTGVRYSTDTGDTWQTATSGLAYAAYYGAKVIGDYVLVSVQGTTQPVYQYSTNPTGTSDTWNAVSSLKSSNQETWVTHYLYDSTDNVLMCGLAHKGTATAAQGKFAVRITGITGSGTTFSGSNADLIYNINTYPSYAVYPCLFQSGDMRRIHIGYIGSYDPLNSGWQDTDNPTTVPGRVILNGTNPNIRPNPFYRPLEFQNDGHASAGTTNSGTRYLINGNTNNQGGIYGPLRYFAIYVEESGFFKPLRAGATGEFADRRVGFNVFPSLAGGRNNFVLHEASGNYLCVWHWSGNSYGSEYGVYNNNYSQVDRRSTGDVRFAGNYSYNAWTTTATVVGGTKDQGVYVIQTVNNSNGSANDVIHINPTGGVTNSFYFIRGGGSYGQVAFSDVHNEVIISTWTTTTVSGAVAIYNNGAITTSGNYTLVNATGGVLSTIGSGSVMIKTEGNYYVFDSSGNLYGGTSPTYLNYIKSITTSTNLNNFSQRMVFREIGSGLTYGTLGVKNLFGEVTSFQTRANGSYSTYAVNRGPEYFNFSGNVSYIETPGYGDPTTFTTQGTGVFVVPNIVTTTTGESKYIIAR